MFWFKRIKHTSVDVVCVKHRGRVRKNNEDYYKIIIPNGKNNHKETVLLLADGMGGYKKGEIASKVAIESFEEYFFSQAEEKKLSKKVYDAIQYANSQVFELSSSHSEFEGMGTTLVALVIYSDYAVIGNVGDSRVYVFDSENLIQISEEHTYVSEIGLTPEQAKNHPNKNIITRSIGKKSNVQPYVNTLIVRDNISFLLCSDGLTTHVSDRFIRQILSQNKTLKEKVSLLLKEALKNGGTDNISIIVAVPKKIKKTALTQPKKRKTRLKIYLLFIVIISTFLITAFFIYDGFSSLTWFSLFKTDSLESVQEIEPKIFLPKSDNSANATEINIIQKDRQNAKPYDSLNLDKPVIKGKQNE